MTSQGEGTVDIFVKRLWTHAANVEIYAKEVRGPGTNLTVPGTNPPQRVVWQEVLRVQRPAAKYEVLTPIDDSLQPVWTTPRFS